MSRIWRGIAIFVLGGVLGTGAGVAIGFMPKLNCELSGLGGRTAVSRLASTWAWMCGWFGPAFVRSGG